MMQQGINTLEIDQMAAPQAQGIETLGSMEDAPMIPNGGIQAAVPDATEMLAAAGREGDIYIIHAAEGDTVIPEEVLAGEGGPQIREMLFRQMAQMGVDPERYVVGNELNSINPETGLPEFFFKKIFESIKKVFKKVAPVVLPIALSLIPGLQPLGAVALGALGSGAGTLIAGGSAKDALKAAAFGGITAGITSGLAGGIAASKAGGDFFSGFGTGLQASVPALGGVPARTVPNIFQAITGDASAFVPSGAFAQSAGNVTPTLRTSSLDNISGSSGQPKIIGQGESPKSFLRPSRSLNQLAVAPRNIPQSPGEQALVQKAIETGPGTALPRLSTFPENFQPNIYPEAGGPRMAKRAISDLLNFENQQIAQQAAKAAIQQSLRPVPEPKGNMFSDYLFRAGEPANVQKIRAVEAYNAARRAGETLAKAEELGLAAYDKAKPSLAARFLPSVGLAGAGIVGLKLAGAFDPVEAPDFQSQFGEIDPERVRQARLFNDDATFDEIRAPARAPTRFQQIDPGFARFQPNLIRTASTAFSPIATGAYGGETQNFPPRIGAISGPGTEKSDDVPAMLSDGEFVMTARAVRGAGNGSRRQGVKNLYDIMRNFEAVV